MSHRIWSKRILKTSIRGQGHKSLTAPLMSPRSDRRWKAREEVRDPATFYLAHVEGCSMWLPSTPQTRNLFLFPDVEPLMKPEEKGSGEVSWSVYGTYIKAAGGPIIFIINAFLFLSTTGSIAFSNWWLSHWIRQGSGTSAEVSLLHCKLLRNSAPPLLPKKRSDESNYHS